jgi:hypothetical protein
MAPQRITPATFLAQADQLHVELARQVMDPTEVKCYLAEFTSIVVPSSQSVQSVAKLFHRGHGKSFDVKTKSFGSGQTSLFNEAVKICDLGESGKLVSTTISPIAAVPHTAEKIELITSYTYGLAEYPSWVLQISLVKTLSNPLEFSSKLVSAKTLLVGVDLEVMDPSAYDYVLTKLIRIDDIQISYDGVVQLMGDVSPGELVGSKAYQSAIYSLAKDIYRDAITISQFKRQSGFKRLCSNTVELSRPIYFKQVLPAIDTFYMTDKMDGTRAMLIIDEYYRRSGHRRIFLGAAIKAVSDQVYDIQTFPSPQKGKVIETDHTVLDVEMMPDGVDGYRFHCFDVIALKSRRLSNAPFKERFTKFDEVQLMMEKYDVGSTKTFVKLEKDGYGEQIKTFMDIDRPYHVDGIIFTPEGSKYKPRDKGVRKFERVFNTDYSSTISFKWKPLDQLTIDFYLMSHPTKKGVYMLCSGVDANTFARLQLSFFDGYTPPNTPNSHRYFPIQFEPLDGDFATEWSPSKEDLKLHSQNYPTLDGLVGEFAFADSQGGRIGPKLLRLRVDRAQDIAKGEYFGNALRYSELIWHSIQHPLTVEAMCNPTDIGYFAVDNNDWFRPQRSFNSFAKSHLLETYLFSKTSGNARIMDLMAGKGQDLGRAIDIGYDEIILLDRDIDAIYELLERKYNLRVKRKNASANIHIKKADFESSADLNIKALKVAQSSIDSSMANFAIHYLCHAPGPEQANPLVEFAKFNAFYLKPGGRLMLTAFNGDDVFRLLHNKDEWGVKEHGRVKYSIRRQFSSDSLTNNDQAIDVLLPFSGGRYYREYLVNYDYVEKVFEENGFKMIKTDSFGSLLRAFKSQNSRGYAELSDADKEYVSLYGYMVFERL